MRRGRATRVERSLASVGVAPISSSPLRSPPSRSALDRVQERRKTSPRDEDSSSKDRRSSATRAVLPTSVVRWHGIVPLEGSRTPKKKKGPEESEQTSPARTCRSGKRRRSCASFPPIPRHPLSSSCTHEESDPERRRWERDVEPRHETSLDGRERRFDRQKLPFSGERILLGGEKGCREGFHAKGMLSHTRRSEEVVPRRAFIHAVQVRHRAAASRMKERRILC